MLRGRKEAIFIECKVTQIYTKLFFSPDFSGEGRNRMRAIAHVKLINFNQLTQNWIENNGAIKPHVNNENLGTKLEIFFFNFWKKIVKKKFARQKCRHFNEVGRKINFFFCFGYASQNKALDTMKLVSNIFFFHQRIYCVNFKRIVNGPQCQIDNFDHYYQRNFQKNLKIGVSFFEVIHNTWNKK